MPLFLLVVVAYQRGEWGHYYPERDASGTYHRCFGGGLDYDGKKYAGEIHGYL